MVLGHGRWLSLLLDTILIAFMGTLLGTAGAFAWCFPAARNVTSQRWASFVCRRCLEIARTIPDLVYALIFVYAFGLGPFAGVMAIAVSDTGTLAKLFAEAIENIERRQVEGVRAAGANRLQLMRFAMLPQVLPVMLSHVLYYFESNTRSATILGVIGAGGIGMQLADRIRVNNWDEVGFILIMILVAVSLIDTLSRTLRLRFIHGGPPTTKAAGASTSA